MSSLMEEMVSEPEIGRRVMEKTHAIMATMRGTNPEYASGEDLFACLLVVASFMGVNAQGRLPEATTDKIIDKMVGCLKEYLLELARSEAGGHLHGPQGHDEERPAEVVVDPGG